MITLFLSMIRRRYSYSLACVVSAASFAISPSIHAQALAHGSTAAEQKNYRIPAGSLAQALALFAETADVSLSYDPALTQGKSSAGLSGAYTVTAGFAKLLEGSGLAARFPANGGYVLRPLPTASITTDANDAFAKSVATLPVVTVTGSPPEDDYAPAMEVLATGTATPLHKIPQSVQVISSDIINDQQSQNLSDIMRNIGGASNNPALFGYGVDGYELRGFDAPLRLDGVVYPYIFNLPAIAIERVEVLKGAESALAGDMAPSGVISVTTKQPQREPVYEAALQVGSFGDAAAAIDVGDAFSTDSRLLYRVVISAEHANENFADYRGMRQFYLAPSIAWDDGATRLVLGAQYTHGRVPQRPFTIAMNGRPVELDHAIDNEDEYSDVDWKRLYYQYSHKLNTVWSIRSNASVNMQSATQYSYTAGPPNIRGDAYFLPYTQETQQRYFDTDNSVTGRFSTGNVQHNAVLGLAYQTYSIYRNITSGAFYIVNNIFAPTLPFPQSDPDGGFADAEDRSESFRLYAQDFMSFGKRWHVMTAMGLNRTRQDGYTEQAWTPKLGISHDLSDMVSVYGTYSRSVAVQPVILQNGALAPPASGKAIEAGIKLNWPDKPLDLSLAVFRASQSNLVQQSTDIISYDLTPGGNSRGVELSMQGRLTAGWKVIASYTYTDFDAPIGQVNQTPRHTASLWNTYDFQNAELHNWGVGMGLYSRSAYGGGGTGVGDFLVPGQTRIDLSLFYRDRHFSATLGIKNVFDRALYDGGATAEQVFLESERTILLTTSYRF